MKQLTALVILVALTLTASAQLTINDVTLPAALKAGNSSLVLNGGGVRKKAFFKVYVAGLYVESKTTNAEAIVNDDKPMLVRLKITSSLVSSSNMTEAIREGFTKSTGGKTAPIQAKIDAFIATFNKEEIKEGDLYDLVYQPGEGVKAYKNGQPQTTVAGLDFKRALFGIWLSANPVDADLKTGLLGK